MKLFVLMIDSFSVYCSAEYGIKVAPKKRLIEIPLTDEQKAMLQAQKVGTVGLTDKFEEVEDIWFEEEK